MQREVSGVMFSYMSKSQYHDTCIPSHQKAARAVPSDKPLAIIDYTKCDAISEDKIWKQSVWNEQKAVNKWKQNWGYLTEYDYKGRSRQRTQLPDYESLYSHGPVPNTTGGIYGSRVNTDNALTILKLERSMASVTCKKKLDREIVCY